jgi:cytochrome P450/deferrochelatase/peroxidase EfeB
MKDPLKMPDLLLKLAGQQAAINEALNNLHYVHFARFLPAPKGQALQVITSFDGDFRAYVLDFVLAISRQFDLILSYIEDWPPGSAPTDPPYLVKDHPAEFLQFITERDINRDADGGGGIRLYSAYPDRTVIDIVGAPPIAPPSVEPPERPVDLTDVQANVLHGIGARYACHVGLRFGPVERARALLHELLESKAAPTISNGTTRLRPPGVSTYALTVGFTYSGLTKLGIADADRKAFALAHHPFVRGPDKRDIATAVGDIGTSGPAYWQFGGSYPVDMVVSLYANDRTVLDGHCERLRECFAVHQVSVVNDREWPANLLRPGDTAQRHVVHFGYIDGFAQPRLAIQSTPSPEQSARSPEPDMQPRAGIGEFLLGEDYPNVFGGKDSLGGLSPKLAQNATFAAMRIMHQDAAAFETLLNDASASQGVDREWVAAKLMGRWRDGTPLEQSPDRPVPEPAAPPRNCFDYSPSTENPSNVDDSSGLRCPIGAHARRMNPRSATVAGRAHSRRLLRRGMPYGPLYKGHGEDDGKERGLIGLFLCADLERQYEFIMRQWVQGDRATSGIVGQQDPIIGAQSEVNENCPMSGQFRIPRDGGEGDVVLQMPRLVHTVGSVYLFMPGLTGLRHLAEENGAPPKPAGHGAQSAQPAQGMLKSDYQADEPDPATFDPRAREFRADPFAIYKQFRANRPIVDLPLMASTWVFSYDDVDKIARNPDLFRKRKSDDKSPAGLLNMDGLAHKECRREIQLYFDEVLEAVRAGLKDKVEQCYATNCKNKGQVRPIDWVAQFARPVAHAVFFDLFGLEHSTWLIRQVEDILALATPAPDKEVHDAIDAKREKLGRDLLLHRHSFEPSRLAARIMAMTTLHDTKSNTDKPPLTGLLIEQLTNAATMSLTGILTVQWFVSLAVWHLLENESALLRQIKSDRTITNDQVIDELLRFDTAAPFSKRYVFEKTEIHGVPLDKDQCLMLVWASANRDEKKFGANAGVIDFKRGAGPGLAFGDAAGDRHCLGRELVRAVMQQVLDVLRKADPEPRLAKDFVPLWGTPSDGAMFRAMVALRVHS